MILPKRIFVDTSAWIEITLSHELHHVETASYFRHEDASGSIFFTSDYVLDEAYTRLLTSQSITSVKSLREKTSQATNDGKLVTVWTDEVLFEKAWKNFVKFTEHRLSFTDALIATIVKDLKIDEVLSLDAGFVKIGLTVKPALTKTK